MSFCLSFSPLFHRRVVLLGVFMLARFSLCIVCVRFTDVSCWCAFISALFLYFLQVHPYLKWSFAKTLFPLVSIVFGEGRGGVNQLPHVEPISRHSLCYSPLNTLSADVEVLGRHSLLPANLSQPMYIAQPVLTSRYAITLQTSTSYKYAGLDGLQLDQVNRENDNRTSTYTQLTAS